ncbi:UDP-glucose 4-epimerase GalE [Exiguobacterium sp. SH3S2]|uniref:UDP-glucose 4-epimerase GalE n=1 Tax=unclassified Exiguobacterium TaxID=2644629 RepID=UPI00103F3C2B|nr:MULTISPECIES: UDP-glucose 4-epimerase GalE [unclassified Exiguobacterium]TCI46228.1 UDP-glucose 4-epimerase GalE [Exiguobacterium sp. SH3S3]TCI61316.1 UDP-glucose 4-epimerase GalE [Exiguobacterium sp. SH3S2]
MTTILVTGGAGYIGTHTVLQLLETGHDVIVLDNLSNSRREALDRVEALTGKTVEFYLGDILDRELLEQIFLKHTIDAVIHFAGLKAVGESVNEPLRYYENNVVGTTVLLDVMNAFDVKRIVFSSSATVYGMPERTPIDESFPLSATNPYGRTKLMIEDIMRDLAVADPAWSIALLRYFNPIGAHESGQIGEDPFDVPNNLMPYITQVAVGRLSELSVFGDDYDTPDGTGVRDYIHVVDLAEGHLKALDYVMSHTGAEAFNLGTGTGYSVLDLVKAFEAESGKTVPYKVTPRRPGDIGSCYADPTKSKDVLGWEAKHDVRAMCRDAWNWQANNPNGYRA